MSTDIDDISLGIDTAIPCGLIINELISNALKYAFPGNKSGEIKLSFKKQENNVILIVSDDGGGIPSHIDIKNSTSLGMRLIYSLTKQLDGNIVLESGKGTTFTLIFSCDNK
jgi:two-component sensor histidine kinase